MRGLVEMVHVVKIKSPALYHSRARKELTQTLLSGDPEAPRFVIQPRLLGFVPAESAAQMVREL